MISEVIKRDAITLLEAEKKLTMNELGSEDHQLMGDYSSNRWHEMRILHHCL